jgi:Abortive infection alpha
MLFGKERQKVARAIRDLVVRPKNEMDGSGNDGDLGGGLQVLARLAAAPLRLVPQTAVRIPLLLRELGERRRAIPPARRLAPDPVLALQALTGCLSSDEIMRTRYLNLLAASMDRATSRRVHPGFLTVLRQLTPDETRIFSRFESDGPYPVLSVQSHPKHGGSRRTELRHFSLLGEEARCEYPARAPLYLDNLCRLGLTELRATRLSEDTRMFKPLEAHAEVTNLLARIAERPPVSDGATGDPLVADVQYKYLFVTSFGRQFYDACEYRPEGDL